MRLDRLARKLESYLAAEMAGRVAVLRLADEFIFLALDLDSKRAFMELLDTLSTSPKVGAVAIVGNERCFSMDQANHFWRHILDHESPAAALATPHAALGETDLHREETGIQQLALKLRDCAKAVVFAIQGEVPFMFVGAGLVCDYRICAENTVFLNRNHALGLPPGGALTYLLPHYIGFGKASGILLEGRSMAAAEALELGLVNEVVPADALASAAIETGRRFAALPWQSVAATKKLLSHSLRALGPHFDMETSLLKACMLHLSADALDG